MFLQGNGLAILMALLTAFGNSAAEPETAPTVQQTETATEVQQTATASEVQQTEAVSAVQQETVSADQQQGVRLCDEEHRVLVFEKNQHIRVLDGLGRFVAEFTDYSEGIIELINADAIMVYRNTDLIHALSIASGKDICTYPAEGWVLQSAGQMVLAMERDTGRFILHDREGEIVYESEALPERDGPEVAESVLMKLESGYLAGSRRGHDCFAAVFDEAGNIINQLPDELARASMDWGSGSFGDYLLVSRYENDARHFELYSADGNLVMDHINDCVYEQELTYDKMQSFRSRDIRYVLVRDPQDSGKLIVYDTSLRECGRVEDEGDAVASTCYDGFFRGLTYDELGGRKCDGLVIYRGPLFQIHNCTWYVPYAKEGKTYHLVIEGKPVSITLQKDELSLEEVSETFYVTLQRDGTKAIRRIKDGSRFPDETTAFPVTTQIFLPRDGVMVAWKETEEFYSLTLSYTLYDLSGRKLEVPGQKCSYRLSQTGYLQLSRGIYEGYADSSGNWLYRWVDDHYEE